MNVEAEMENEAFIRILEQIENFAAEFFELLDEVDSHKEVTLLRIKTLIDDRTKAIVQEAKLSPEIQNKIINHQIEITQTIENQGQVPSTNDLPDAVVDDTSDGGRKLIKTTVGLKPYKVPKQEGKKLLPEHRKLNYIQREKDNKFRLLNGGEKYSKQNGSALNHLGKSNLFKSVIQKMSL